jgi:SAM-dependent methyltransferase
LIKRFNELRQTVATSTDRQSELFDEIHDRYYASTADEHATAYKDEFVFPWVLAQLGQSKSLIEIASGEGIAAGRLRDHRPALEIAGCDISQRAVEGFKRRHGSECYLADMTKPFDIGRKFDTVLVMGGIHHLVGDLDTAFANIENLLNDGGRLIMAEPNADYMLEPLRRIWYALDKSHFDDANEHALSHGALQASFGDRFGLIRLLYRGGPAYFLLTLNYVFRMPSSSKLRMARSLMGLERLYHKLPGKWPYAFFMACWEKRGSAC